MQVKIYINVLPCHAVKVRVKKFFSKNLNMNTCIKIPVNIEQINRGLLVRCYPIQCWSLTCDSGSRELGSLWMEASTRSSMRETHTSSWCTTSTVRTRTSTVPRSSTGLAQGQVAAIYSSDVSQHGVRDGLIPVGWSSGSAGASARECHFIVYPASYGCCLCHL